MRPSSPLLAMLARTSALVALLAATAPPVGLKSGMWRIVNTPQRASLDGRPLADLPFVQPAPEEICLSPMQAADPARWFTRDSAPDCVWQRRQVAGGKVVIAGSCPAADTDQPAGSVRLTGTWTPTAYRLRFSTIANGANGRMGFDGTLVGTRIGDCSS